jgi:hypothetical protein
MNVLCSITLDFPLGEEELINVTPDYMTYAHDFEVVAVSSCKNTNLVASIDRSNMLMIHGLSNGVALNKIQLSKNIWNVNMIWINNNGYYVTISGTIKQLKTNDKTN